MQDPSSTPSSTVSSYHGTTPGTALTQLSPDGLPQPFIDSVQAIGLASRASPYSKDGNGNGQAYTPEKASLGDRSLPSSHRKSRADSVKLSATAVPFTPRNANISSKTLGYNSSAQEVGIGGFTDAFVHESSLNDPFLNQARRNTSSIGAQGQLPLSRDGNGAVGPTTPIARSTIDFGHASRYIQVSSVPKDLEIDEMSAILGVSMLYFEDMS